jgi:peptidoglycan hydrolase CwlO-like protein
MKWTTLNFRGWNWRNPLSDIHDAELEVKRLVKQRDNLKAQLRAMPDKIAEQFKIIDEAKERITKK